MKTRVIPVLKDETRRQKKNALEEIIRVKIRRNETFNCDAQGSCWSEEFAVKDVIRGWSFMVHEYQRSLSVIEKSKVSCESLKVHRKNRWRQNDVVLWISSDFNTSKCVIQRLSSKSGEFQKVRYDKICNLCRTNIALFERDIKGIRRWSRFKGLLNIGKGKGDVFIPTQLGYMMAKSSSNLAAHQLCLDYAMGEGMIQDYAQKFEDHLDGFPIKAIWKLLNKFAKKCAYCHKPGACTTCAHKRCKSKDRSWYHLPCGQRSGSKELPGDKKSFCSIHAVQINSTPRDLGQKASLKRPSTSQDDVELLSKCKRKVKWTSSQELLGNPCDENDSAELISLELKYREIEFLQSVPLVDITEKETTIKAFDQDEIMNLAETRTESSVSSFEGTMASNSVAGPISLKEKAINQLTQMPSDDLIILAPAISKTNNQCRFSDEENTPSSSIISLKQKELQRSKDLVKGLKTQLSALKSKLEDGNKNVNTLSAENARFREEIANLKMNLNYEKEKSKIFESLINNLKREVEGGSKKLRRIKQVLEDTEEEDDV